MLLFNFHHIKKAFITFLGSVLYVTYIQKLYVKKIQLNLKLNLKPVGLWNTLQDINVYVDKFNESSLLKRKNVYGEIQNELYHICYCVIRYLFFYIF